MLPAVGLLSVYFHIGSNWLMRQSLFQVVASLGIVNENKSGFDGLETLGVELDTV